MTPYERLLTETNTHRTTFLAEPLLQRALRHGVSREVYLAYLEQAYHHVRLGVPLLALGAARAREEALRYGLYEYVNEEKGHEHWILASSGNRVGDFGWGRGQEACG